MGELGLITTNSVSTASFTLGLYFSIHSSITFLLKLGKPFKLSELLFAHL